MGRNPIYLNPKRESKSFLDCFDLDLEDDLDGVMSNKEPKPLFDFLDFELDIPKIESKPLGDLDDLD